MMRFIDILSFCLSLLGVYSLVLNFHYLRGIPDALVMAARGPCWPHQHINA